MTRPQLTVLTDPVPYGVYGLYAFLKQKVRQFRKIVYKNNRLILTPEYRGHYAVTRSLVEGLKTIGVNVNYNPVSYDDIGEVVIVLSGIATLHQAIRLRRKGVIRKLLAGPNILVFPSQYQHLITQPEVDVCLTPSEWVCEMYVLDCIELTNRCIAWPAGVDINYWIPSKPANERQTILIYNKQHKIFDDITEYIAVIESHGFNVRIIEYGSYHRDDYLKLLQESKLMVCFSSSESQGIAWAEAWSVDVPTLIKRVKSASYLGKSFSCSSAPYLNADNGDFFDDIEQFRGLLIAWAEKHTCYQPRNWLLDNMTDEVCAQKILDIIR